MIPLTDFEFNGSYNRIDNDIAEEFYLPCMRNATAYDRISGYFGSSVYVIAWDALKEFIQNGGVIRLICSPVLSNEDQQALEEGSNAWNDSTLLKSLENELEEMLLDDNLSLPARLLTCLIAKGVVTIKIGLVKKDGHPTIKSIFHDKVGIFHDDMDNRVAFRGSFNETYKGLSNDGNIESVDVFQSWDGGKDATRVTDAQDLFDRIWRGEASHSVIVKDTPDALKEKILQRASQEDLSKLLDEIKVRAEEENKWKPYKKGRSPRKHQINALDNWVANGRRGILKHATGSGKTFTAICAIKDSLSRGETVLVLVPSKELLYHWKEEIQSSIPQMDIYFLLCGDGNNTWKNSNELSDWTGPNKEIHKVIIAMMSTASSTDFYTRVVSGEHLFVVADEAHRLGSVKRRNIFSVEAGARLGLSATPERYGDEEGTRALFEYFGGIVQPEFSLKDAIDNHVLTRYFYHPEKAYLEPDEQEEWDDISKEISKIVARSIVNGKVPKDLFKTNPFLSQMMIKRARILKNARGKIKLAMRILTDHFREGQKWIVYCDNQDQLREIRGLAEDEGLDAYEYYADMPGDRETTLKYFERNGGVLVSIKCLDEGVDIPSTTHALIIASSKNPREFIQRRGRVLRLSEGKAFAHIYDAVILPSGRVDSSDKSQNIVLNELARAIQFGTWAENPSCITDMKIISLDYGINYNDYANGGDEDDEE
jgi:superfamily II DNA or RNA helicase